MVGVFFIEMNEIILILSVIVIYGSVLLSYKLLGKNGLFALSAVMTVLANIEVLILINAFGMEQTLGNVMFAATYVITDILSENEDKKDAALAVKIGIFTSVAMLIFTGLWLLYTPSPSDIAMSSIRILFSRTPRLMLASMLGYTVSQILDVWLYHRIWKLTEKKSGSKKSFLWLRNNAATLISQLVNAILFTFVAFLGVYPLKTVITVMASSYVIYIFTSLLDTPVVYIARRIKEKGLIKKQ